MAIANCRECGKEVSDQAKTCPHCGVSAPVQKVAWLWVIVFGILVALMVKSCVSNDPTPKNEPEDPHADKRYSLAIGLESTLKKGLRDPESLKIEQLYTDETGGRICALYRARNGFGGMNKEVLIVTETETTQDATRWNDLCTGLPKDMLWAVQSKD